MSLSKPYQARKDHEGSWVYKTKKKTKGCWQFGQGFILHRELLSRAAERSLDKTGLVVAWSSEPQRTFLRYDINPSNELNRHLLTSAVKDRLDADTFSLSAKGKCGY